MAMTDWNGDGKKDFWDDLEEDQIYFDLKNGSKNNANSGDFGWLVDFFGILLTVYLALRLLSEIAKCFR